MSHRRIFIAIVLGILTCPLWAGVPVRPGIPVYCITTDGKLYVDKKSILDQWLKENDYELDRAEKGAGEAYAVLNKAGKTVGYAVIDRNISMKNAWDKAWVTYVKGYVTLDVDKGAMHNNVTNIDTDEDAKHLLGAGIRQAWEASPSNELGLEFDYELSGKATTAGWHLIIDYVGYLPL